MSKCALIGEKLSHSYSKQIHDFFGLYGYELVELRENEVAAFLRSGEYAGVNVTIPYKRLALKLCDTLSPEAQRIGSVNTVLRGSDGRLHGHNTDYCGFSRMAGLAGISFAGKKALILGSGGTSLTAKAVISDSGASDIIIVSRTGEVTYDRINRHSDAHIIVNTTPVGMYPNTDAAPIDLCAFLNCQAVIDVIYNPLRTRLMQQADELGIKNTGGMAMLAAQGIRAAELFTGTVPAEDTLPRLLGNMIQMAQNIVLVGMPGCGKSSIAACLGALSGRKVVETDDLITEKAGISIEEIFARGGESAFRAIEADVIAGVCKEKGRIISTGGGAVKSQANRQNMRQNGRVYRIKRRLEALATEGRPLSQSADLTKMALEREPLYAAAADRTVQNDSSPDEAAAMIWADFVG